MLTKKHLVRLCSVAVLMASYPTAHAAVMPSAIFWGPTAYLSASDIPAGFYLGGSPTLLDNLEDNSLDSSLSASAGSIIDASSWGTLVDSVDADDGVIDGLGNRGHSWFSGDVTFTYVGSGPLPTAFGLVWTDGSGAITFTATDGSGQSLPTQSYFGIPDNTFEGTTVDDRFFGVQFAGGIKSITIRMGGGGIEVDHIQYGQMVSSVPEPSTTLMLGLGLFGIGTLRRSQHLRVNAHRG